MYKSLISRAVRSYPLAELALTVTTCIAVIAIMLLSGCAITPTSIVKQPTTAKAPVAAPATNANGAIFNVAAYHPMFEDRRPRFVGDIVTINITENTSANKAGANSSSKTGNVSFNADTSANVNKNIPLIGGFIPNLISKGAIPSLDASSKNAYTDKAASSSSNVFSGSITATVTEVLPNGYLMVSGEKQVAFDKGTEFVRFSGVVNPDTISLGNTVPSTKVADARIEYRTNNQIDGAAIASIFARFFLSLSPW